MRERVDLRWWGNLLGYQASWFIAVMAAGRGAWWPGALAALVFVAWQLADATDRPRALRVLAFALVAGIAIDGWLARSGLLGYAAASPALPNGGAPLWILGLWMSFAMTLPRSLAFLHARPAVAALLGAIGAPMAYLGAASGWQAVEFASPEWPGLLVLGGAWALALPLMAATARPSA
jgi:hypothetical protein